MKTIEITAVWKSHHTIEVPDDFEIPNSLNDFPEDALEAITSEVAELVDWH